MIPMSFPPPNANSFEHWRHFRSWCRKLWAIMLVPEFRIRLNFLIIGWLRQIM